MEINKTKRLANPQFYSGVFPKKHIFWHHTAGTTADGAISWWNQTPERVGTAYVIERDGTIFEVFDPKLWGFHLGVKTSEGGNPSELDEKQSIGIEIVSAGHLYKDEKGNFVQYPLYPNKLAKNIIKPDDVWDMGEKKWHGFQYFQKYTDKQVEALIWLTKKLVEDFNIPVQEDITKIFDYNPDFAKNLPTGIYSHSTVRKDKEDVIPHPSFVEKIKAAFNKTSPPPASTKNTK